VPRARPLEIKEHSYSAMQNVPRGAPFNERNQYFLRSAYRAVHDPAAPQAAQAETTDRRVRNTKDVSVLRIGYISIEGMLLGVRQASGGGGLLDCKEMNVAHLIVARPRIKP